jgi:hypothetical protein
MSNRREDIGYLLSINSSSPREIKIDDPTLNEYIVNDLSTSNTLFIVRMRTYNSIGVSDTFIETFEKTFESG